MNLNKENSYNSKINLNLIFFLPNFSLGGAAKSILKLCKNINCKNFSITVISLGKNSYKKEFLKLKIKIVELKKKPFILSILNILNLINKIDERNNSKSILISNINYCNVIFPLILNRNKIQTILIERTPIFELDFYKSYIEKVKKILIKFLIKFSYKKSTFVITNSNYIKKELTNYINKDKIHTIHPDILITKNFKKKKNDRIKLLWVGRYSYEKNIDDLINSLQFLENYNFHLTIIIDKNLNNIKSKISKKNQKKIKIKKFKNDISKEFLNSHVLIITSVYEGFPNVVAEAINYNCLIISSKSKGGINDLIKNSSHGIFYELYNPKSLSNKIIFALNNYEKFNKIIKKNRINLVNLSSKNKDKYKNIFSKII
jgi:glycosyltransferase involved in cell wall biosynthesis